MLTSAWRDSTYSGWRAVFLGGRLLLGRQNMRTESDSLTGGGSPPCRAGARRLFRYRGNRGWKYLEGLGVESRQMWIFRAVPSQTGGRIDKS